MGTKGRRSGGFGETPTPRRDDLLRWRMELNADLHHNFSPGLSLISLDPILLSFFFFSLILLLTPVSSSVSF